jgi:arsenate reductase (glutaredoxin)
MSLTLFGIPNCQTVKKARNWLSEHATDYSFYDFKKQGVHPELLQKWLEECDISQLLNRSGMTYRNLTEAQKMQTQSVSGAIALMCEFPSMIKRPILDNGQKIFLGFNENLYQELLGTR